MFSRIALTVFLATSLALMAKADVTPDEPGPGTVYKTGGTCRTTWNGDKDSTTAWKNMSIELMTGDNFNMIHLTTVASNLDGTKAGIFQHPCPVVTLNAPVYFYQYSAPIATTKQWTTRFTIASASGQTTPAPNATQPGSGDPIPWGIGALSDPSTAVPPPPYLSGSSLAPPSMNSTSGISSSTTSSSLPMSSPAPANSGATSGGSSGPTPGGAGSGTTTTTATAGKTSGTTTPNNGATGNTYSIGSLALAVSVLGFTVLF